MDRVAIYCRLSDEDKNKVSVYDASESIQNQKSMLTQYAIEKKWEIYKIYSDDDYSGLDKDRPEWNQMLEDAEQNKFNIILSKSQSRFARDMESIEKYLHNLLVDWGIRFVGYADNSDTLNKGNKKQRQIMGLTNEWYCEDISENIRSVFDYKRKEGKFIGSFAAYGYKKSAKDKNKIIIDDEAAAVIRKIFAWYLEGYGVQHIAYMLNQQGIYNPTRYKQVCQNLKFINSNAKDCLGLWNKTTVKRILKSQIYIGNMVQGKRKKVSYKSKKIISLDEEDWIIVEGTHEPIINQKTFKKVQDRMKSRKRSSGQGKAHVFSTKLRCADCKNAMVKNSTFRNGVRYSYFRCKLHATSQSLCSRHGVRFDHIEDAVMSTLRRHLQDNLNEDFFKYNQEVDEVLRDTAKQYQKEKKDINKKLKLKSEVIKNLYEDKIQGIITSNQFVEMNEMFLRESQSLENRLAIVEDSLEEISFKDESNWLKKAKEYCNMEGLTHITVSEFIDLIEISEKDDERGTQKIKIYWRF